MTQLVTVARYVAITGDITSPPALVSARIEEAQELLEDELDRPLASAARTERMWPARDGRLWPKAVPITDPGTYTLDGDGLLGVFGPAWPDSTGAVDVPYTGGWVERTANPTATNRLPVEIERDLAFAALALKPPPAGITVAPKGAVSVRLGDAAVNYGPNGAPKAAEAVQWSRATLRWRYRGGGIQC